MECNIYTTIYRALSVCVCVCLFVRLLFIDGQTERPTELKFDPHKQNFTGSVIGWVPLLSDLTSVCSGPK